MRCDGRKQEFSHVRRLPVGSQTPAGLHPAAGIQEIQMISDHQTSCRRIEVRPEGAVHVFVFQEARVRPPVGIHQSVQAEIPVVLQFSVIPAVPVHTLSVFRDALIYRVIAPLPDEAAAETRILFDQLPVLKKIPGAVAHGVAVLHKQQRFFRILLQICFDLLKSRIHPSDEIDVAELVFPVFRQVVGALIGGEPGRIRLFRPLQRLLKGASVAALVSHGPDQHGGTVPVPQHHGAHPVQGRLNERRVVGDPLMRQLHPLRIIVLLIAKRRRSVAFIVRFIDDVQAQGVAELVKIRDIRIVAGPHRVEIVGLDHFQVLPDLLHGHTRPCHRIGFVAVDAPEFNGGPVQEHHAVPDADFTEADIFRDRFVLCLQDQPVQVRGLRRPEKRIFDLHPDLVRTGVNCFKDPSPGVQLQLHRNRPAPEPEPDPELRRTQVLRKRCRDHIIFNVVFRTVQKIHVADDAGHPEFVLVLQITAVTPFQDQDCQKVLSLPEQAGDVKLRGMMRDLAVADVSTVQPHVEA